MPLRQLAFQRGSAKRLIDKPHEHVLAKRLLDDASARKGLDNLLFASGSAENVGHPIGRQQSDQSFGSPMLQSEVDDRYVEIHCVDRNAGLPKVNRDDDAEPRLSQRGLDFSGDEVVRLHNKGVL